MWRNHWNDNEKVRDPCHITGKFRGADHWSCNKNLQLTKTFPVIVHNLRGYGSHLIFCELKNSCFYSSVKDGTTDDNGKKLDGHISDENYLRATKFGTNLTWKSWVIITIIIWKEMFCY